MTERTSTLITRENAAEYARRAAASRKARLERERQLRAMPQVVTDPLVAVNLYNNDRLLRVRKQIDLLDKRIESLILTADEDAASAIDRLVSAQSRLSEQERVLSGRPLPGSLRPRAGKQSGQPKSSQAIADEGVDDGTPNA